MCCAAIRALKSKLWPGGIRHACIFLFWPAWVDVDVRAVSTTHIAARQECLVKPIQDFLAAKGTVIMMAGFAIIAIDAAVFGYMHLNGGVTEAAKNTMVTIVGCGFAVYITGRIGVVIQRRNARKINEFAKDEPDTGKNA
jgi:hypothetical protein